MTGGSPPREAQRPLIIGLTGPIGCGKSTVAQMLGECGGTVLDADLLARRATERGHPTLPLIRVRFGDHVFDESGALDRPALARIVFGDPAALSDLERIVHPEVRRLVETELEAATAADAPFVVVEAIKLVEGGLAERCDEVWLVECPPDVQVERLRGRGATGEDVEDRLQTQGHDLIDRLDLALRGSVAAAGRPLVRRLPTGGSLDQTRELVEDALADAFEATPGGR